MLCIAAGLPVSLQAQDTLSDVNTLKRLSLEELLDLEVTLVSKTPEKLSEVASAIQVLTSEDIRRSGATRLPEALRLAANMMVAQANSHDWAVTARGFNGAALSNNTLSNKLLVMIDGRTVYSQLFGGVFWDVQSVVLEDIDRIEIISGPGGTLWGANAMNGVINIITKSATETKGIYGSVAGGNHVKAIAGIRYGGSIGSKISYRVYGRFGAYGRTENDTGLGSNDQWHLGQGGFRLDYAAGARDAVMISGDYYAGQEGDLDTGGINENVKTTRVNGQFLLGRWTHLFADSSTFRAQVFIDRTWRDYPQSGFSDALSTYDLDLQHGFSMGTRHKVLWGIAYRLIRDETHNVPSLSFYPERRTLNLFTGFVQDQIGIVPGKLDLILGTKLLYNDYSFTDYQPSARLSFRPTANQTFWTAVSRAVRTPTRFDADVFTTGQSFQSEKQIAYEGGYRGQLSRKFSFSIAAFHSRYKHLRSVNVNPATQTLFFANDQEGNSTGIELSANYWVTDHWRLRGGYTLFDKNLSATSPLVVNGSAELEGIDPRHQALLQSILDLPRGIEADVVLRYVGSLTGAVFVQEVLGYVGLDVRLARTIKWFELSLVGQNLLQARHREFGTQWIPRSVYVRLAYRLIK